MGPCLCLPGRSSLYLSSAETLQHQKRKKKGEKGKNTGETNKSQQKEARPTEIPERISENLWKSQIQPRNKGKCMRMAEESRRDERVEPVLR
jgi:hypothetical protein